MLAQSLSSYHLGAVSPLFILIVNLLSGTRVKRGRLRMPSLAFQSGLIFSFARRGSSREFASCRNRLGDQAGEAMDR